MNKANSIDTEKSRRESLLRLQKEFLAKTIKKLDETIELTKSIQETEDIELATLYSNQLDKLLNEIEDLYSIACDIESKIQR